MELQAPESSLRRQLPFPSSAKQEIIIDWTGTETFAKEPNLAKLLRDCVVQ